MDGEGEDGGGGGEREMGRGRAPGCILERYGHIWVVYGLDIC